MGVVTQNFHLKQLTMKLFLVLAAVGAASAASSNAVACEECQKGAADLVDHLLTPESLGEQAGFLKVLVCPQTPDPAGCEAAVDQWFPDMANCIYTHFVLDGDVCSRLGLCKKMSMFTPRDWTAKNALTSLPGQPITCLPTRPLPKELSTSRENAFVDRLDTQMTVPTLFPESFPLLCQFSPRSSTNRLLSFAKMLLVFVRFEINNKL